MEVNGKLTDVLSHKVPDLYESLAVVCQSKAMRMSHAQK